MLRVGGVKNRGPRETLAAYQQRTRTPAEAREIMFWSEEYPPENYAGSAQVVRPEHKEFVVDLLKAGNSLAAWMGYADCRICGERLGTQDLGLLGLKWPEKAEHYVLEHDVWTPGLTALFKAAQGDVTVDEEGP